MWLTLLWQNKGLVALAVLLAAFVALGTALKVQNARLATAKDQIATEKAAKDEAIKAHDALVDDWARQQRVLNEREALRKQQEAENDKLHKTIKDLLSTHRAWATGQLPRDLVGVLRALPQTTAAAPAPDESDDAADIQRPDQRRFTLLGDGK